MFILTLIFYFLIYFIIYNDIFYFIVIIHTYLTPFINIIRKNYYNLLFILIINARIIKILSRIIHVVYLYELISSSVYSFITARLDVANAAITATSQTVMDKAISRVTASAIINAITPTAVL